MSEQDEPVFTELAAAAPVAQVNQTGISRPEHQLSTLALLVNHLREVEVLVELELLKAAVTVNHMHQSNQYQAIVQYQFSSAPLSLLLFGDADAEVSYKGGNRV